MEELSIRQLASLVEKLRKKLLANNSIWNLLGSQAQKA